MRILMWSFFLSFLVMLSSCEKEEGFGGNAHISGTLVKKVYNDDFSLRLDESPAMDEDVFLLIGSNTTVGEKVRTSYTGSFNFDYLFPGNYKVYYYSKEFNTGIKAEIVKEVTLKKGQTAELGELIIYDTKDFNDGHAVISGKVMVKNYFDYTKWPNLVLDDITPAQEKEVYLVYGNHKQYDERIRTNYDGTFTFSGLIKGKYLIYVFSEDVKGGNADIAIKKEVQITEEEEFVDLGEIVVENI